MISDVLNNVATAQFNWESKVLYNYEFSLAKNIKWNLLPANHQYCNMCSKQLLMASEMNDCSFKSEIKISAMISSWVCLVNSLSLSAKLRLVILLAFSSSSFPSADDSSLVLCSFWVASSQVPWEKQKNVTFSKVKCSYVFPITVLSIDNVQWRSSLWMLNVHHT